MEAKLEQILQREELIIALLRSNGKDITATANECVAEAGGGAADGNSSGCDELEAFAPDKLSPTPSDASFVCCKGENYCNGQVSIANQGNIFNTQRDSVRWSGSSEAGSLRELLPSVKSVLVTESCDANKISFSVRAEDKSSSWSLQSKDVEFRQFSANEVVTGSQRLLEICHSGGGLAAAALPPSDGLGGSSQTIQAAAVAGQKSALVRPSLDGIESKCLEGEEVYGHWRGQDFNLARGLEHVLQQPVEPSAQAVPIVGLVRVGNSMSVARRAIKRPALASELGIAVKDACSVSEPERIPAKAAFMHSTSLSTAEKVRMANLLGRSGLAGSISEHPHSVTLEHLMQVLSIE